MKKNRDCFTCSRDFKLKPAALKWQSRDSGQDEQSVLDINSSPYTPTLDGYRAVEARTTSLFWVHLSQAKLRPFSTTFGPLPSHSSKSNKHNILSGWNIDLAVCVSISNSQQVGRQKEDFKKPLKLIMTIPQTRVKSWAMTGIRGQIRHRTLL